MNSTCHAKNEQVSRQQKRRIATLALSAFISVGAAMAVISCLVSNGQESVGQYVDDATITTKAKAAIASEASISLANQVGVETGQGVVQLSGFVPTTADKERAEEIAMSVKGVRNVKNNLVVQ